MPSRAAQRTAACACCAAYRRHVGEAEAFAGGFVAAAILIGKGRLPALCDKHFDELTRFALKYNVEIVKIVDTYKA
jgi:hypothetical protein